MWLTNTGDKEEWITLSHHASYNDIYKVESELKTDSIV